MKSIPEPDLIQIPKNVSSANALESMNRFLKRIGLNYNASWGVDDLELSRADGTWMLTETKKQELILQFQTELERFKAEMIQREEKLALEIEQSKRALQDKGYPTKTDMIRAEASLRLAKAEKGKIGKTTPKEKRTAIEASYNDVLKKRNTVFSLLQKSEEHQRLIEKLTQELRMLSEKISKNWYLEVDFKDSIGAIRVDSQEIESEEEEVVSLSRKRKWNYPIGAVALIVAGIVALTLFAKMKSDSASNHTMPQISLHNLAKMTLEQRLKSMANQSNIIIQKMLNRIAEDGNVTGFDEKLSESFSQLSTKYGFAQKVTTEKGKTETRFIFFLPNNIQLLTVTITQLQKIEKINTYLKKVVGERGFQDADKVTIANELEPILQKAGYPLIVESVKILAIKGSDAGEGKRSLRFSYNFGDSIGSCIFPIE